MASQLSLTCLQNHGCRGRVKLQYDFLGTYRYLNQPLWPEFCGDRQTGRGLSWEAGKDWV